MSKKKEELQKFEEDLIKSIYEDFELRREERLSIERQWKLNLNYVAGNQYCEIAPDGSVKEEEKYYGWQSRSVFNHISPIIDVRLAKLSRVRPSMSVRASSSDDGDIKTAILASDVLSATSQRISLDKTITNATGWSEVCGTVFYKITWNDKKGKQLGEIEGVPVFEGDVEVSVVPPFEIFPDNLFAQDVKDLKSIIHARAVDVSDVKECYGEDVVGTSIDVFSLTENKLSYNGGYTQKKISSELKNHVLLIEKYEKPSENYPNGRYIAVAGGKLLHYGELPYINGASGTRDFPFVKQVSTSQIGAFFGVSIVERLIPIQRAYNAVKNRKYEFLNRVSMGVLNVEDGSVDTDELIDEGLSPGKVIVYRQGARPPQIMSSSSVPIDFSYEEERLSNEFITISGTSEVSRTSDLQRSTLSGTAIELLIEQDETRLSVSTESIKHAVKETGKQIIRLFKQFATDERLMRSSGEGKEVRMIYFKASDLSSDDVVFDTENEITKTPAQKKTAVLEMLSTGLLSDDKGNLSLRTKSKLLEVLGYGSLSNVQDIVNLHRSKAEKENAELTLNDAPVDGYDDHEVHIEEHLRKLLTIMPSDDSSYKKRLENHVNEHKKLTYKAKIEDSINIQE
ncbi:MAG: hypothetical protein IKL82_05745 [Clostridia bacterium]|nr:hypothetical protein [Clostridia bacterium]